MRALQKAPVPLQKRMVPVLSYQIFLHPALAPQRERVPQKRVGQVPRKAKTWPVLRTETVMELQKGPRVLGHRKDWMPVLQRDSVRVLQREPEHQRLQQRVRVPRKGLPLVPERQRLPEPRTATEQERQIPT